MSINTINTTSFKQTRPWTNAVQAESQSCHKDRNNRENNKGDIQRHRKGDKRIETQDRSNNCQNQSVLFLLRGNKEDSTKFNPCIHNIYLAGICCKKQRPKINSTPVSKSIKLEEFRYLSAPRPTPKKKVFKNHDLKIFYTNEQQWFCRAV